MVTIKKCFGEHDYSKELCYSCPQRVDCMAKKFADAGETDFWGEVEEKPPCFGSYKGRADCGICFYRKECSGTSKAILRNKTQKRRYGGKYKARGKEIERDIF
jgi:hypothetical protein